jgi:hypothetical protein
VGTPAELPGPFAAQLAAHVEKGERVETLIWVPADRARRPIEAGRSTYWTLTRGDQVLATTDRSVIIGSEVATAEAARWIRIPYGDVVAWGVTESLLYGRFDVCGDVDGKLMSIGFEFNTVGRWMVEEALIPLHANVLGVEARAAASRSPGLHEMPGLPLKFVSFLREALLAGENPVGVVFEERGVRRLLLWRRTLRPAQLVVTTELRLLVVREDLEGDGARYGFSTVSLPRRCLGDLVLVESEAGLTVRHAGGAIALGPAPLRQ